MTEPLKDSMVSVLQSVLDRSSVRAAMVASNLANVDTPGYRAMDVTFDEVAGPLRVAPSRTDPSHLGAEPTGGGGEVVEPEVTRIRPDGNTVDVDRQMALLGRMQGRYAAATEMVKKRFALMIYAATSR